MRYRPTADHIVRGAFDDAGDMHQISAHAGKDLRTDALTGAPPIQAAIGIRTACQTPPELDIFARQKLAEGIGKYVGGLRNRVVEQDHRLVLARRANHCEGEFLRKSADAAAAAVALGALEVDHQSHASAPGPERRIRISCSSDETSCICGAGAKPPARGGGSDGASAAWK